MEKPNSATMFVAEYNSRKRLRGIGFFDSLENLDALTAEYFLEIDKCVTDFETKELESRGRN